MPKTTTSIEQLLADLHHPTDFTVRCDAARELGKVRDPRAVQALLGDLNDSDWRVRRNAAQALGVSRAVEAVEPLIAALHDRTSTVRCRAAVALGRIKDPRSIDPLLVTLFENDDKAAWSSFDALGKFGKTMIYPVFERMKTADSRQRATLLRLLGNVRGASAMTVDPLIDLLRDPDHGVRCTALELLGKSADRRALDSLLITLNDANLLVQCAAAKALGEFHDPRIVPALLDQLDEPDLFNQKRLLYQTVTATLQHISGMPEKYTVIFRSDPVMMTGLLGGADNPQVSEMVERLSRTLVGFTTMFSLNEDEPPGGFQFVRGMLARMSNSGEIVRQEVEDLLLLLNHPAPLTRIAATVSLPWYGRQRALEPLRISCMDPDPDARRAAQWAVEALALFLQYRQAE